jgi:hypothetical protein
MEWIFMSLAGGGILVLVLLFALTGKRHGGESVPGRFGFDRFDHYKAQELSQRGLFDNTKRR